MSYDLDRRRNGRRPVKKTRQEREADRLRELQRQGDREDIIDEVHLTAFKIDGSLALGRHAMAEVALFDRDRRDLADGDELIYGLLVRIEKTTLSQVERHQRNLFNEFGL